MNSELIIPTNNLVAIADFLNLFKSKIGYSVELINTPVGLTAISLASFAGLYFMYGWWTNYCDNAAIIADNARSVEEFLNAFSQLEHAAGFYTQLSPLTFCVFKLIEPLKYGTDYINADCNEILFSLYKCGFFIHEGPLLTIHDNVLRELISSNAEGNASKIQNINSKMVAISMEFKLIKSNIVSISDTMSGVKFRYYTKELYDIKRAEDSIRCPMGFSRFFFNTPSEAVPSKPEQLACYLDKLEGYIVKQSEMIFDVSERLKALKGR